MARVKMLKTACGPKGSFVANQVVEIDDDTALAWADAGACHLLSTPTPPQAVERAVVTNPVETAVAKPQRTRKGAPTRTATPPPRDPGPIGE